MTTEEVELVEGKQLMTEELKAMEEMAELTQVLAKKLAWDSGDRRGYSPTGLLTQEDKLRAMLIEELGDVRAILGRFFNSLDYETRMAVIVRQNDKEARYKEWWG